MKNEKFQKKNAYGEKKMRKKNCSAKKKSHVRFFFAHFFSPSKTDKKNSQKLNFKFH